MDVKGFIKGFFHPYFFSCRSYAQEGEDLVINRLLGGKTTGFYVEVGCHHPFRFSNTYFFYRKGWRGICIDPLPGTKKAFNRWRKRDKVLEVGVSDVASFLTYHMFNEPALNTFDEAVAREKDGLQNYKLVEKRKIPVEPLSLILDKVGCTQAIDFLSVDVEGLDLQVLQSNDWEKYRPAIIIAESLAAEEDISTDSVYSYLKSMGYKFYAKTGNSLIYKDARV